jgi:sialate O-acetylesterase
VFRQLLLACVLLGVLCRGTVGAEQTQEKMPREDVVQVPAIGQGLCVSNIFQTNMVLQREKPLNIWGWADPGEEVSVSFADQQAKAQAAADRSWQVTLDPMPANTTPQECVTVTR